MSQFEADGAGSISADRIETGGTEANFAPARNLQQKDRAETLMNDNLCTPVCQHDFSKKSRSRENSKVLSSPENIEEMIKKNKNIRQQGQRHKRKGKKKRENQKQVLKENKNRSVSRQAMVQGLAEKIITQCFRV